MLRRLIPALSVIAALARLALRRLHPHALARTPGQGLVEYGLVLVLIMIVCVAILSMTGQTLSTVWYTQLLPALDQ